MRIYKIQNKLTGKFVSAGGGWTGQGRVFHNLTALKLHLRVYAYRYSKDCAIVTYDLTEVKSSPIDEFITR